MVPTNPSSSFFTFSSSFFAFISDTTLCTSASIGQSERSRMMVATIGPMSGSGGIATRGARSGGVDRALIEGRLGLRGPAH
ncbi:hypothetical protein VNO80_17176 [Phaseolus coccineus]|uniref:Uncharacterized protein n=1 Tax=Phaseolus coccineus TaxID=3886 RepID=A0AAN9MSP1_PHACN